MKKKVLALALALVLVCSMGAALAANCLTLDWSSSTNCGQGTIEVVPYAIGNKVGGNTFTATDCAAAVNNDYIYFAIKVTVAANPDQEWWKAATITATETGISQVYTYGGTNSGLFNANTSFGGHFTSTNRTNTASEGTYYLNTTTGTLEDDDFDPVKYLFKAKVDDAANVKICAKLKSSKWVGIKSSVEINGATVDIQPGTIDGVNYKLVVDDVAFVMDNNGKSFDGVLCGNGNRWYSEYIGGVFIGKDGSGNVIKADGNCNNKADYDDIIAAMDAIQITWGQKISLTKAQDVLGWSNSASDCAVWNADAMAIVSPNCVVEIPKTGDVSVIAYAVMALVAAAGAMGLKK